MEKLPKSCCCTRLTLPLAFNDSMSYLEDVCAIEHKINEIIDIINNTINEELEKYINKHFNNIMMNALYEAENETLILSLRNGDGTNA